MDGKEKNEQQEPVTLEKVEEKIGSGGKLTPEEEKIFLENDVPVEGYMHEQVDVQEGEAGAGKDDEKPGEEDAGKDQKKADPAASAKPKEEESGSDSVFVKLERELAKPDGKEDLSKFTERERAYFFQMRKDRKRAQIAEGELDAERRNRLKLEQNLKSTDKQKEKEVVEDPLADLKKKDPTDFLTVAEVTTLIEKMQKTKPEEKEQADEQKQYTPDPRQMKYLQMCEKEARDAHPEDFDLVMELTEDVINTNPKYLVTIAQSMAKGENPALKAYELIKADPDFNSLITVAKTKQEATAGKQDPQKESKDKPKEEPKKEAPKADPEKVQRVQAAEAALNKKQTKTTGHIEKGSDAVDNLSFEEMALMSDLEFARQPKAKRQAFLRQMQEL